MAAAIHKPMTQPLTPADTIARDVRADGPFQRGPSGATLRRRISSKVLSAGDARSYPIFPDPPTSAAPLRGPKRRWRVPRSDRNHYVSSASWS
jgi:hypothetical protein